MLSSAYAARHRSALYHQAKPSLNVSRPSNHHLSGVDNEEASLATGGWDLASWTPTQTLSKKYGRDLRYYKMPQDAA